MNPIFLNCDLGEGEPRDHTVALMSCIDAANIACGVHAGDENSMVFCIEQALQQQVKIGAHPGCGGARGRGHININIDQLRQLLDDQVLPFYQKVVARGGSLHHIKLHGSLYHATDLDPDLAAAYLSWCRENIPAALVIARSGGTTAALAHQRQIPCWRECFLDRHYEAHGGLRDRSHDNALIHDIHTLQNRLAEWTKLGLLRTIDGQPLQLSCDTFCLHSDTPQSLAFARIARQQLGPRAL